MVQCRPLFIAFLVVLISSSCTANKPCTPMDSGAFPSVPPILLIDINEANEQELKAGGYLSEIRLNGVYGSKTPNGIQLTFDNTYRTINPNEYFVFEYEQSSPFRNMIRLLKPIDRDGATDSFFDDTIIDNFRLKCVPYKNQTLEYWYDVSLFIRDVNDNVPQVAKDNINSTVNELMPVGSILPNVNIMATDKDSGSNRELTYKISSSSKFAEYLEVHNKTGKVYLQKALDYETLSDDTKTFQVPIIIHDNGKLQQHTSTTTLTITVADGDDQGPQFKHLACQKAFGGKCFAPTYNADVESVQENKPILFQSSGGGSLMQIEAKDGDTLGAKLEFKISAVLPSIHKSSFQLKVTPAKDGYQMASLMLKSIEKSELVGTVVYVTVTEDTPRRHYSVARILFKERNSAGEKGGYNNKTLALAIVVAILSVIVAIGICTLIFLHCRKSKTKKLSGYDNDGMSNL